MKPQSLTLNVHCSERQYRTRITRWGQDKNIKKKEMGAIVRKYQQRNLVDTHKLEQKFTVRGTTVEPDQIDQWMVRYGVSRDSLYAPSPTACEKASGTLYKQSWKLT